MNALSISKAIFTAIHVHIRGASNGSMEVEIQSAMNGAIRMMLNQRHYVEHIEKGPLSFVLDVLA